MLASKETQDNIDVKISAYRAQAAKQAEGESTIGRQSGRGRRVFRSDDGGSDISSTTASRIKRCARLYRYISQMLLCECLTCTLWLRHIVGSPSHSIRYLVR